MAGAARQLILASSSPRRRELLQQAGYDFTVLPPDLKEPKDIANDTTPGSLAEALSFFKARAVARNVTHATVIGADTVVAAGDIVYGKPADEADARRILADLMTRPHEVITGITLLDADTDRRSISHDVTEVTMRPMPDDAFEEYLRSRLWIGKAGAYGIQDHDDAFIEGIQGSFTNVMGLPMELLTGLLTAWKHHPSRNSESGAAPIE
jgi:septum formation protein